MYVLPLYLEGLGELASNSKIVAHGHYFGYRLEGFKPLVLAYEAVYLPHKDSVYLVVLYGVCPLHRHLVVGNLELFGELHELVGVYRHKSGKLLAILPQEYRVVYIGALLYFVFYMLGLHILSAH